MINSRGRLRFHGCKVYIVSTAIRANLVYDGAEVSVILTPIGRKKAIFHDLRFVTLLTLGLVKRSRRRRSRDSEDGRRNVADGPAKKSAHQKVGSVERDGSNEYRKQYRECRAGVGAALTYIVG
mgnify:CR=1